MREQTDSVSFAQATESQERKSQEMEEKKGGRVSKTRPIHKQKMGFMKEQVSKQERSKLTKEERAKIQKQKNREAAQRSRDMHKEYVTNLEREVKQLKEELARAKRYCVRCQQILETEEGELLIEPHGHSHFDHSEQILTEESNISSEENNIISEPDSFLRILQPQEESSIIKHMFFVCMIAIAVMVVFNKEPTVVQLVQPPRGLVQIYSSPAPSTSDSLKIQTVEIAAPGKCQEQKGLVSIQRGLQNQNCLDSLMRIESPVLRKSLRSIHDNSYQEGMDSIFLCSLRTPKLYQIKPELTDNPLVRLFVIGSQIKELVSRSGSLLGSMDRNIQLNGIYKLSAEIKSVELVSQHSCLL